MVEFLQELRFPLPIIIPFTVQTHVSSGYETTDPFKAAIIPTDSVSLYLQLEKKYCMQLSKRKQG